MAVDMFLKLDAKSGAIDGESTDDKHANEIEVLSWSWGMSQSGSAHSGGGAGSGKVNVIPAEASAQLDVRLLPGQDPALFLADLRQVIGDDSIRIEPVLAFPPSASPMDTPFYDVLRELAGEIDPGVKVTTPLLTGFTDCHFFREKGIPCYGFAPFRLPAKELAGVHGNDERLSLDNLAFGTRTMIELVRRLAQ